MVHGFNFDNLFCITSRLSLIRINPMDKTLVKIKWMFEIFEKKRRKKKSKAERWAFLYIEEKEEEEEEEENYDANL